MKDHLMRFKIRIPCQTFRVFFLFVSARLVSKHTSMRRGILSILQTNSEVFPFSWSCSGFSWGVFRVFWVYMLRDVPVFRVPVFLETLHAAFKNSIYIFLHGSIDNCVSWIYMYAIRLIFVSSIYMYAVRFIFCCFDIK